MGRYFLRLAYNGSAFHGWQSQPNAISVQQRLEESISILLRSHISITGAGRTDTGVHAKEMYAHFDYENEIADTIGFITSLNKLVGKEIAVDGIYKVNDDCHARFDAVSRTYKYFISYQKSPFLYPFSYYYYRKLDIEKMNEGCEILKETVDFTSFAKLHSDNKTNICEVSSAYWKPIDEKELQSIPFLPLNGIVFSITADRFLRNMVRSIVGTMVDIGRGKYDIERLKEIIEKRSRNEAGTSMPAEGLFLWEVKYPYQHLLKEKYHDPLK